jgi:CBS-domain-containing membrane protein
VSALHFLSGWNHGISQTVFLTLLVLDVIRLGITHPPAGAAAIVFASGKLGWQEMGVFLSGVSITIITAVSINNMCDKRQYPTSWPLLNKAKDRFIPSE